MYFCEYIKSNNSRFDLCNDEDTPLWCDVFVMGDIEILDMSIYTKKFIKEVLFDKYKNYYFVRSHIGDDYTHITYFKEEENK